MIHLIITIPVNWDFPGGTLGKESTCQCRRCKQSMFDLWDEKIPWRRKWQPLQYSCLENSMDRGAWQGNSPWSPKCQTRLSTHACIPVTYILNMKFLKNFEFCVGFPCVGFPFVAFPCGSAGKESTCNVGDLGLIPGLGRSPGEGKGYPFQYSGLDNSMNCIVHGVAKSWTRLSNFHFLSHFLSMCNFKVLDWPKSSFGFFHNGNTIISFFHNECSGQPNIRL